MERGNLEDKRVCEITMPEVTTRNVKERREF